MSDMTRERAKEVLEMMLEDKDVRKALLRTDVDAMKIAISALTEELSADGTLTVHVKDGSKVKRVFVMGDNIFGGLYYPDSAENKGDLISRQAVLDWIKESVKQYAHTYSNDMLNMWMLFEEQITAMPSVENKGEWISTEDRPDGFCSKCDTDIYEVSTPYCPYCGAKMTWVGAIHEPYKKGE